MLGAEQKCYKMYERNIAHIVEAKFINNSYTTPNTIECRTIETDASVNIAFKYRKIFAAIKLLDSSTIIVTKSDTIITHHD